MKSRRLLHCACVATEFEPLPQGKDRIGRTWLRRDRGDVGDSGRNGLAGTHMSAKERSALGTGIYSTPGRTKYQLRVGGGLPQGGEFNRGSPPLAILRNKNEHPSTRLKSSQSQSGPLLCRHMLVGSRPSRTTLSHRLQSLLGAPCWSWDRSQGPLPTCI